VAGQKPDVYFNRKVDDIEKLCELQAAILETASRYVRSGGALCYSTCTVFKEENDGVIEGFLKRHAEFNLADEPIRLFPHIDGCDGFYIAKMIKTVQK
jgi:16S rRNA (cytosine967-C5)-methyltransferase